jgi:hypothetical protein
MPNMDNTPTPEGQNKPKWLAPHMYGGEGKHRDPLRINSWFRAVGNNIKSFNITESDPDALQYYRAYLKS